MIMVWEIYENVKGKVYILNFAALDIFKNLILNVTLNSNIPNYKF